MKKKEMMKFAQQIAKYELIHQNPSSDTETKVHAEQKIMELTNKICSNKDGLNAMLEIDILVQEILSKLN